MIKDHNKKLYHGDSYTWFMNADDDKSILDNSENRSRMTLIIKELKNITLDSLLK